MINDFAGRLLRRQGRTEARRASRLSFAVERPEGEGWTTLSDAGIGRYIVRSGNSFTYSIGDRAPERADVVAMEYAKAAVIGKLSASREAAEGATIDLAREIACAQMLGMMEPERARRLSYFVAHDTVGAGIFSILMEGRDEIEEIEVNSPASPVAVYTVEYGRCMTNLRFADENAFMHSVNKFIMESEKELGEESPIIDVQVKDARLHAQTRPYAAAGAAASVRIGKSKSSGMLALLKGGTLEAEALAYLWIAVDAGMNMVVTGAPASGKTTLLRALVGLVPRQSKIVTVEEEVGELSGEGPLFNVAALYGSRDGAANTRAQVINALRMRPDRIVVGEVRGEETRELFAGSGLGIPFITTMHSAEEELATVKKLLIRPMAVEPRALSMLDVSIHMRQSGIRSRLVSKVCEYRWLSRAEIDCGVEIGDGDSVASAEVVREGRSSESVILSSKAFMAYARRNDLSPRAARKALAGRIAFLRKALQQTGSDKDFADAMENYRAEATS